MAKPTESTNSFEERWAAKERTLGLDDFGAKFVVCGDSVLPSEAAPCLSFGDAESMPAIWEVFGRADDWSEKDKKRLEEYRMLGSDGAGNPICVEKASLEIWLLDHEDHFNTLQFVNSGISQLAECLLAYMGEKEADQFRSAVEEIDPPAIGKGTFWYHEAACIGTDKD